LKKNHSSGYLNAFFNKDSFANDSSLSTTPMKSATAETTDIVSKLF